jgi:hypothetical protein
MILAHLLDFLCLTLRNRLLHTTFKYLWNTPDVLAGVLGQGVVVGGREDAGCIRGRKDRCAFLE